MRFLRINMGSQEVLWQEIDPLYIDLGGRGLTSTLINKEVPPDCDPLGRENKLIFAPGLLTGTPLANTARVSVGAKSPLTRGIKESNAGGTFPLALSRAGIAALIIEGTPENKGPFVLYIGSQGVRLEEETALAGMRTYALVRELFKKYGRDLAIMCIGPAGELELKCASIQSVDMDGRPCRAAGRGGLGAVMGAKGLKAIVIEKDGQGGPELSDLEAFKEASKLFAGLLKKNPFTGQMLPEMGTACLVSAVNNLGAFPSYNAKKGVLEEWEKISGEHMAEVIKNRGGKPTHMGCSQCIIRCSNEYVDPDGRYVTASLEYETIWAMGGMLGIDDLDTIARLDFLADDIGLDTMSTGVAMAVAMDAGYREFGDREAAIQMIEEIPKGTKLGKALGNGPEETGSYFGHNRVPTVKGQSIAAYDPRAMQGNGVTYATSPMGADHTAGNLIGQYLSGNLDPLSTEGQVEASRRAQVSVAALDSIGLCLLAGGAMFSPEGGEAMVRMLSIRMGKELEWEDVMALGRRVLRAEREFNRKAGFTSAHDRLPEMFLKEPLPPHNKVFMIRDQELDKTFDF